MSATDRANLRRLFGPAPPEVLHAVEAEPITSAQLEGLLRVFDDAPSPPAPPPLPEGR